MADDEVLEILAGSLDASVLAGELAADGYATRPLLNAAQCAILTQLYDDEARFRKRIIMQQRAYGRGEYQYFAYPLPDLVARLRADLYPSLAAVANDWQRKLDSPRRFPADLESFLAGCHAAGQTRPTPLLLRYGPDDFNCLHQDLYGDWVFPLQITILLSTPGKDFTGGEFMLVEQRPRAQSRGIVVPLHQGEAVIFPVRERPGHGSRGAFRLTMRHGVSRVRSGQRHTLGLIFHDAA